MGVCFLWETIKEIYFLLRNLSKTPVTSFASFLVAFHDYFAKDWNVLDWTILGFFCNMLVQYSSLIHTIDSIDRFSWPRCEISASKFWLCPELIERRTIAFNGLADALGEAGSATQRMVADWCMIAIFLGLRLFKVHIYGCAQNKISSRLAHVYIALSLGQSLTSAVNPRMWI
jgi:hypothetical protein